MKKERLKKTRRKRFEKPKGGKKLKKLRKQTKRSWKIRTTLQPTSTLSILSLIRSQK